MPDDVWRKSVAAPPKAQTSKRRAELSGRRRQSSLLSLSEIKSEHADGVIRREFVSGECAWQPEQPAGRLCHITN